MPPDPHAGPDGCYQIRSLYFDDWRDHALREKLYGISRREKFRLRLYNYDLSLIRLEKKVRRANLSHKESVLLTESQVRSILSGDWDWMQKSGTPPAGGVLQQTDRSAAASQNRSGLHP